jgi:hypothetical protein
MRHCRKLIPIILFLVLSYSIYIYTYVKIPTQTEGFTNGIRESVRPTLRFFRLSFDGTKKTINSITNNYKLKFGI